MDTQVPKIADFNEHGRASVLIDGQFGSTGKGLAAAYIAAHSPVDYAVTNAAPNAGHTTILPDGRKFVCFHLPTAGVICKNATIYLNSGAVIDRDLFFREIETIGVDPSRIVIHPNAAVIEKADKEYEGSHGSGATKIASTQKGVGRAIARKIMREGVVAEDCADLKPMTDILDLNTALDNGQKVMVEVPQGHSLSLASRFYPHCTSRNVSVGQGLSDANIHPSFIGNVMMTARTYPIRVGNIPGHGYSGDYYSDQKELTWEDLGQEPEKTTVTGRIRRVFTWSSAQYFEAVSCIRPSHVFLNFCNYLRGQNDLIYLIDEIHEQESRAGMAGSELYFGFGPCTTDIIDDQSEALFKLGEPINGF